MQEQEIEVFKAIRKAIKEGRLSEVVRLVREDESRLQMDTPFGSWLHMAAAHGRLEIARWLVSQGMDVNIRGRTIERRPLDEAAANGHVDTAKYLIESGATLDVSDSVRNPLLAAIVGGNSESHTAVARLLTESGIDTTVRYPNLDNMDALEYAKEWGRSEIVELLDSQRRKLAE